MKRDTQMAFSVMLVSTVLFAACSAGKTGGIDTKPIGSGLEFLGMAGILVALIFVLGRYIGK